MADKLRIYIPELPAALSTGEYSEVLVSGVAESKICIRSDDPYSSDYVLLDFRNIENGQYLAELSQKTIIVDYRDLPHELFHLPCKSYFKRSIVRKGVRRLKLFPLRDGVRSYSRRVFPISYCVKQDFLASDFEWESRSIDVACFFDPEKLEYKKSNRLKVAKFLASHFKQGKVQIGQVGLSGEAGRSTFQSSYAAALRDAKVVVTCNPDHWEGDYRLFEAMSLGALVCVDKMHFPFYKPLRDKVHLVFYELDRLDELAEQITWYLINERKRLAIAKSGTRMVRNNYRPQDIINHMLSITIKL
jgi:hypothetical protein